MPVRRRLVTFVSLAVSVAVLVVTPLAQTPRQSADLVLRGGPA